VRVRSGVRRAEVLTLEPKSGVLELRERANSELKGEVVLSCNLKTFGTHSTGVTP